MKYRARAPLRIDFGGGWTDFPQFAESEPEGGAALCAAIDRYARGSIARPESAAVLGMRTPRTAVRYEVDAPPYAGLGASAAQTLLWVTLVKTTIANVSERRDLAEIAWRVDGALDIPGGRRNHYASAVGGITFMTFDGETEVQELALTPGPLDALERRLVLAYAGPGGLPGAARDAIWTAYRSGDRAVVEALRALRRLAFDMREALTHGNLDGFGALLDEHWQHQKALHPEITSPGIDALHAVALRTGALGGKVCGAGGGGCLVFLADDGAERQLTESLRAAGAQIIPSRIDWYGVHLTKD